MYISSVTLIHEISRSKVKTLERVFKLYSSIYLTVIYLILFSSAPLLLLVAHPVLISYILIGYAILVRIRLRTLRISWFIYLLVLIFLGGVIILIIYITSIAANEKFNFQKPLFFEIGLLLFSMRGVRLLFLTPLEKILSLENRPAFLISLIEAGSSLIYFWITFYLLLVLIRAVKIVKLEEGPLVQRL